MLKKEEIGRISFKEELDALDHLVEDKIREVKQYFLPVLDSQNMNDVEWLFMDLLDSYHFYERKIGTLQKEQKTHHVKNKMAFLFVTLQQMQDTLLNAA